MTQNELSVKYPDKAFGLVNVERKFDRPLTGKKINYDYEERDFSSSAQVIDKGWEFYLNHSCDEWVIGTIGEAEEFYNSLNEALEYVKTNP